MLQNETVRSVILWGASILTCQRQASMTHNIYILLQVIPQTQTYLEMKLQHAHALCVVTYLYK